MSLDTHIAHWEQLPAGSIVHVQVSGNGNAIRAFATLLCDRFAGRVEFIVTTNDVRMYALPDTSIVHVVATGGAEEHALLERHLRIRFGERIDFVVTAEAAMFGDPELERATDAEIFEVLRQPAACLQDTLARLRKAFVIGRRP